MYKHLFIIGALLLTFSCVKETPFEENVDLNKSSGTEVSTKSSTETQEYQKLPNPYALSVMQSVYNEGGVNKTLLPTDLYVRFLPKDSLQLRTLYESGLELFGHPLDIKMEEGGVYSDPTINEGEPTWLYTAVPSDFIYPDGIRHEIIEECYVPKEEELIETKSGSMTVEEAAFAKLGYEVEPETKLGTYPSGTLTVYDDTLKKYVPIKHVKVRCHVFIKWSTAYTDENGNYTMSSKFLLGPHYAIVFQNSKGFDIWGNWFFLAKANLNMGWHSKHGYSKAIDKSYKAWAWATINNAAVDYYNMCEKTGIPKPPKNLKIWTWRNTNASSAAMLRRVWHPIGLNGHSNWANFFSNIIVGTTLTSLNWLLKFIEPDITIGVDGEKSNDIYNSVNHELSHASHFRQVGSEFWSKYIDYIITYGAYGDGTGRNAELCGIGEMWGHCIGYLQEKEKYLASKSSIRAVDGWIKPNIFFQLIYKKTLTKKQLYDCLTYDVRTYDALLRKMYAKYPDKADLIEKAFHDEGISPDVEKPSSNIIYFKDKTVSSSQTINGKNIVLENVNIINNAELTLNMEKSITINSPFVVNSGSRFNFFVK